MGLTVRTGGPGTPALGADVTRPTRTDFSIIGRPATRSTMLLSGAVRTMTALGLRLVALEDEWGQVSGRNDFDPKGGIAVPMPMILFGRTKQVCGAWGGILRRSCCQAQAPGAYSSGLVIWNQITRERRNPRQSVVSGGSIRAAVRYRKEACRRRTPQAREEEVGIHKPAVKRISPVKPPLRSRRPGRHGRSTTRAAMIRVQGRVGDRVVYRDRSGDAAANLLIYGVVAALLRASKGIEVAGPSSPGRCAVSLSTARGREKRRPHTRGVEALGADTLYRAKMGDRFYRSWLQIEAGARSIASKQILEGVPAGTQGHVTIGEQREDFRMF